MIADEEVQGTGSGQMQAGMAADVSEQVAEFRQATQGVRGLAAGPGGAGHGGFDTTHDHHCFRGSGDIILGVLGGGLH